MERKELVNAIIKMIDEIENPRVLRMIYYYIVCLIERQNNY